MTDPFSPTHSYDVALSIYATYTPASGAGQNVTETFENTISVTSSLVDNKEKLISYGESTTLQTELTSQIGSSVTMTETVYQTPQISAALYVDYGIELTPLSALTFAVLAFIIAIFALIFVLATKK
jgi:hypothetical protein